MNGIQGLANWEIVGYTNQLENGKYLVWAGKYIALSDGDFNDPSIDAVFKYTDENARDLLQVLLERTEDVSYKVGKDFTAYAVKSGLLTKNDRQDYDSFAEMQRLRGNSQTSN